MAVKILLVDDSALVRNKLKEVLVQGSYQILEAENGLKALEIVKNDREVGLMICDVNMPDMNGMELCRVICEEKINPELIILMLTTEANPELKETAKNYGVKAWITKPFNPKAVQAAVLKLMATKKA